jgi:hypothetical protein
VNRFPAALLSLAALAACSSPSADWSDATQTNTIASYGTFLAKHPRDTHARDAGTRIAQLQDEADWNRAQLASSIKGYESYLKLEPNGIHVRTARQNIIARQCTDAWYKLQPDPRPMTLKGFLDQCPSGPEADQARVEIQRMTGYRAAFATERNQRSAHLARDRLVRHFKDELPEIIVLAPASDNHDYRVTTVPMSEQDANKLCDSVTSKKQACWIVPAAG